MSQPTRCTRAPLAEVAESIVFAVHAGPPRAGFEELLCGLQVEDAVRSREATVRHAGRSYRIWLEPDGEIGVATRFGDRPLWDYHAQLKLVHRVGREAVRVYDASALSTKSRAWLDELAASSVPPAPSALFSVHCVSQARHRPLWLHTHGLARCGSVELDALEVPVGFSRSAAELMSLTALLFLEEGMPPCDEPFAIGHGIELLWLPWEEGVRKVRRAALGGRRDRHDADHTGARGILFAPYGPQRYDNLGAYREVMDADPLLYVPPSAANRATALARERWPRFSALFERFGKTRGWQFAVKLSYTSDDADGAREHLWFEVHAIHSERIDATLRNQPYYIATMYEGQRATHGLERLSDWTIKSPRGAYDPDGVGELERRLDEAGFQMAKM